MRLIDADEVIKTARRIASMPWGDERGNEVELIFTLAEVERLIEKSPTIEERKTGRWTTDEVAELLYRVFGDECACNYNGIDEWLPMACKYAETTCPDPEEKHGCWKQFLLHVGTKMEV